MHPDNRVERSAKFSERAAPAAVLVRALSVQCQSRRVAMYRAYVDADALAWTSSVCGL